MTLETWTAASERPTKRWPWTLKMGRPFRFLAGYLAEAGPAKSHGVFRKGPKGGAAGIGAALAAAGISESSVGLTVSGLALADYRMGDAVGAYKLMAAELKKYPSSLMLVMSGYFSMLVGKIDEAKALLTDSRISGRESAIAHSLLSQIYLAQNSKEASVRRGGYRHAGK